MYRMLVAAAAAAAATALVIGAGALASTSSGTGARTFTVIEKSTSGTYVDLGPKGFGPGDEFTFASDFWNTARTKKVGHSNGYCVVLSTTRDHCVATARFHGGTLEAAGGNLLAAEDFKLAITGGTGRFIGANGQVSIHSINDSLSRDTIRLVG
jgi:allene oxide cyclase